MAEIYDTDRFAELYYPSNTADLLQLGLAARFIASLFEAHQITYAFIGGWAVYLRGGRRRTQDIDITVATTMDNLKQILTAQSRYLLYTPFLLPRKKWYLSRPFVSHRSLANGYNLLFLTCQCEVSDGTSRSPIKVIPQTWP